MSVLSYIRVSTNTQDVKNQRYEILEYARTHDLTIDRFIEIEISSRKDRKQRRIDEILQELSPGDTLVVSELSRLGRSTGEVIELVNELVRKKVRFIAIKQNLNINNGHDMTSKIIVTLFGLMAELERDLISMRTREALAAKKAQGKILGRPKGSLGKSKLDGKEDEISRLLESKVSKAAIARITGVSWLTLDRFIKSRGLSSS
ncbi:MAG TPA: recombinase family protein [Deltaproteobacteria bacterium]|jgi:DNA invertase Pin-like site-specific DNA recombinase|nr:recombinase family protein [Deltaproteobacteria bacterium]